MAHVVEHLPSKCKALSSKPQYSPTSKKNQLSHFPGDHILATLFTSVMAAKVAAHTPFLLFFYIFYLFILHFCYFFY
jgi:hypothetical protein